MSSEDTTQKVYASRRTEKKAERWQRAKTDPLVWKRKTLMMEKAIHQADLADEWGMSASFISEVVNGVERSYEIELRIAEKLGEAHEELFPPHPSADLPPEEKTDGAG